MNGSEMLAALGSLTLLGSGLGALLGVAARHLRVEGNPLEEEIVALLPGSQCGQCGFPGCGAAAAALARGETPVTVCPPGGRGLAEALAGKLGVSADLSAMDDGPPRIAVVREELCIGCTKCLKRCPTDAIVGASQMIHAVFPDACTGCEKCFDACPTQSIEMLPQAVTLQTWYWPRPAVDGPQVSGVPS